jgi:hypothetical protein
MPDVRCLMLEEGGKVPFARHSLASGEFEGATLKQRIEA